MMKILVLILLSPLAITGEKDRQNAKTNDEPFLPIHPAYPYSPKLIKRGIDKDMITQLNLEIYAPKSDARDSYSTSFSGNYQRDIQASYQKQNAAQVSQSSASNAYQPPILSQNILPPTTQTYNQGNQVYSVGQNGYSTYYNPAPYNIFQTAVVAQSNSIPTNSPYSQYSLQPQLYYQNYKQPYESAVYPADGSQIGHENSAPPSEITGEKDMRTREKLHDERITPDGMKYVQFVDGGNYLSNNQRDLETQSSTYKAPVTYNQMENPSELRNTQFPSRTPYRTINTSGQSAGGNSNIVLHPAYKAQLDQIVAQALTKMLGQNGAAGLAPTSYEFGQGQSSTKTIGPVLAKTGLAYVMNPTPFHLSPRHIAKNPENSHIIASSGHHGKSRRPTTTSVSVEPSQAYYISSTKAIKNQGPTPSPEYINYEFQSGQAYDSDGFDLNRSIQNYLPEENHLTYPGPPAQNYHYYNQPGLIGHNSRNYKTTLVDVDFGSKRNNKRSPR